MLNRNEGKAWDTCFLARLTKKQIEAIPKEQALLVLPIGAVEQHGPHLPVYTDTLIGESLLTYAFEALPEGAPVWLLPPLPYGKSTEHLGHPGTITLSATTFMSVLLDIARSVSASGFQKLVLFNTHGGNVDVLNMMAREIRIETGLAVFRLDPGFSIGAKFVNEQEAAAGIHGGDIETSVVLAAREHWVDMQQAPKEIPNFPASPHLQFKQKAFAWVMNDVSDSGIAGDATAATVQKGQNMLLYGGERIAEALMEISKFDMKSLKHTSASVLT